MRVCCDPVFGQQGLSDDHERRDDRAEQHDEEEPGQLPEDDGAAAAVRVRHVSAVLGRRLGVLTHPVKHQAILAKIMHAESKKNGKG